MVLSRFWLVIFISSIIFYIEFVHRNTYTIDFVLNGVKGDPVLVSEKYLSSMLDIMVFVTVLIRYGYGWFIPYL
jgi:hypothetical protein